MRVKWNRNLDGNTIIDSNEPLSDYKEGKTSDSIENDSKLSSKSSSTIPMRSRNRDNSKSNRGCNLIFGPTRKSTSRSTSSSTTPSTISSSSSTSSRSSSSPPPTSKNREKSTSPSRPISQGASDSDRTTMTKLSNFLGIFKLTPSSPSSTNGSIKGSSKSSSTQPTSIKVVRRSKSGYESDGLFRTDSRRRRRANNLLQRNSDIRRSWNAAMTGVRPDVSVRGAWLRPGSPNYRPNQGGEGNYRSISPSILGSNSNDSANSRHTNQQGGVNLNGSNGSRPSSSLDGSGHFANSCKVNSMPAPIVTLPECCLEGSDCESGENIVTLGGGDGGYDSKSSSKPGSPSEIDLEIHHHHYQHNGHSNGCDEVDLVSNNIGDKIQHQNNNNHVNNNNNKQNGSIVRPTGPPPPPPTSSTSVSYDGSLRSVDDVFIQVQITASSKKSQSPEKQLTKTVNNGRLPSKHNYQQSTKNDEIILDESDRPLSPIYESCTEKVSYEESISPTGSLSESRIDSRSSGEVEEEDDVNTLLTLRPPSSNAGSSSSTEMTLSEDGGLGESVSYDASSGCSWETSSILTGSVCLSPDGTANHHDANRHENNHGESVSERMSPSPTCPIISTSTPHHNHHSSSSSSFHHATSPIMISDPVFNHPHPHHHLVNCNNSKQSNTNDESYLYEPRMSEVIKVTVKKAEIPEVVTLRSEDIIDLDTTGSLDGSPSSPSSSSSFSSSSISSVQRIHTNGRKGNRTGILKDSNCPNSNGLHNCRSSTPKKVHFAESAKIRTTTTTINNNSELNHLQQSANYDSRSSPLPQSISPLTDCTNGNQLSCKPDKSNKLISNNNNNETTITTSSTVTIKKPLLSSTSSRRLFQSSLNQNDSDETTPRINLVPVNGKKEAPSISSGDYSSEQIISSTTQVDPESFHLSNQSSPISSASLPAAPSSSSSSSSPLLSSSLSVKSQARFFESMAAESKANGGLRGLKGERLTSKAIKPVATVDNNDDDTLPYNQINQEKEDKDDERQNINSKSQTSKSLIHNVSTINCTGSVEHSLNQNLSANNTVYVSTVTSTSTSTSTPTGSKNNLNGANSGFPYLSRELDAHRKLSALHQRKLTIAREESARSSLIIQGLGIVVQRLTQQLDNLNGPTLRSQLSQVQNNFNQLEASFNSQEEALKSLQVKYSRDESQLREEVNKLTSELADEERRHEREKAHLINSFELELDAARKQFDQELNSLEQVKDELKCLVDSLKSELRAKVNEMNQVNNQMVSMEIHSRQERNGQARRVEERITFMSKEIQSLKDVLELKEKELKKLRSQAERDENLNRDLIRAQSTIEALRQRLEQLEIDRERQTDSMNKLKAENEALIGEMIRDQREMDKLALRKEELEYTLYNMVTISGDDDRFNNNSSQLSYDNNVSYSSEIVNHHREPLIVNGSYNHHADCDGDVIIDEDKIKEMKRKRQIITNNQQLRSTLISSSSSRSTNYQQFDSPVSSSTSIRIEKNISPPDCYNNQSTI
ncbi:serine-rich adhesin for platelets-like isoform X2 [Panonychus citri]|nr:serine-rich adhesin for platelets-like isoform X2 [Panonychus citri]XP_053209997.1 serine-rich adhesin for platelets-like isoform X2 [Panonychus citri]XP_053209998.1 serine-rich adhesin for platelets-like isoform X2 [Panonychus citri]XP_053209999.1 serine-rich adhesin for platelets-like isoform X2 [Panonychus citri]XP_053210000.1 serine-rich adhesin for platelets-like isoform X2 [Panonychus citri]